VQATPAVDEDLEATQHCTHTLQCNNMDLLLELAVRRSRDCASKHCILLIEGPFNCIIR
jgi:hypothetical protein